ncbi:MAG: hypothetical protein G01um1014106_500 [Parcubacteria group bacterium Gr01-1014_106]|nr:MAG: hypothetical protein G01um1014106_500 [Parcubacteria group bacterium Gr01-1014_106]
MCAPIAWTRDLLPPGTFWSNDEFTRDRVAAIQLVRKIGRMLAAEHPEVAELYRDTNEMLTCLDIARRILSDEEVARSPDVASKAVVYALKLLIPEQERAQITHIRRGQHIRQRWDFTSEEFRAHCRAAAQKRHEKCGVDVPAMLGGRGRTAWILEEKRALMELAASGAYVGVCGGPDYGHIAVLLNERFHQGHPVRYENSCTSMAAYLKRKKR